ncbi:putative ribonuclease H-like domain-containing protein [Tanacetum coccineum]
MTGNIAYLSDFKQFDGGYVAFGGGAYGGKITGKGTLKTDNLDFEDVYFVNELKFNLFSVSQMCDKKNYVLFTDTECLVLSPNFKLPDENQILLKIPRKDNMYSFDMKNIVPKESLTCLVAKATLDESMLWHRRLGHINFKNINKLVKDNLVRGLPTKHFENDQTCVACLKGKQHRASCKSKVLNPITKPLFMLHMDLFGPTFVSSLMHKKYCLVVTDDYSRFTWVFFLTTKDETSEILKNFIKVIENLVDKKVKIIRSDNGTEFKNKVMDDFCREKADSKLPTTFWAEVVSTACYVQNRVLVVKPHNKTPYELFRGFKPALSFMRPFGCHVTILNTLDSLGKFDGKSDEGFFVGYSLSSKAFRVYNTRTKRVEENLHIGFLENKPMIEGTGPKWLFDIDSLTQSMNYVPVTAGTVSNVSAGTSDENTQDCILMPIWKDTSYFDSPTKNVDNGEPKTVDDAQKQVEDGLNNENAEQERFSDDSSSKDVNVVGKQVNTTSLDIKTGSIRLNVVGLSVSTAGSNEEDSTEEEPEVDLGNITNSYIVPTTPNTRIHKDHPIDNMIGEVLSTVQTRRMLQPTSEQGFLSDVYEQKTHDTLNTCLYACFISQIEPTSIVKALFDSSWVEAMQEELLQFKLQQVWILFADDSSTKDVNAVGQQVNTASLDVNTGSLKFNDVRPLISTASPNEEDITKEPEIEPTSIAKSLSDSSWVEAMQEELLQFKLYQAWILVDLPNGKIGPLETNWGGIKEEEGTRKRKLGIRKKMKSKKRKFTSKDDEELRLCLTIVSDEDKEVDYEILDKKYPIIEWRSQYLTTKPRYDETKGIEDVYLNVVIRSNRRRRYFSTLMAVLSILDRDDIYLIIMFNQSGNDEFWNAQQNWKIVSWKLHSSSGIHTIMTDEGIVIHMLVENKYPLKKEVLTQLLKLKLETEEDSTMALELIRFIKKQIAELESEDSDRDEKDL